MNDPLDQRLRQLAQELHDAAPAPGDFDSLTPAPTTHRHLTNRRIWIWATAAAATVVAVIALVALRDDDPTIVTAPSPTTEASASTTVATTTPAPSTTPTPSTAPVAPSCLSGLDPEAAIAEFADLMLQARQGGDAGLLTPCLPLGPPAVFTGVAPACWTECAGATRSFARAAIQINLVGAADGTWYPYASLAVTYRSDRQIVDVVESWKLETTDGGYQVADYRIDPPITTRTTSRETIAEFLGHIDDSQWALAAAMLDDGAISPEERDDLARLNPTDYTPQAIAAALEQWCRDGCDTVPPTENEEQFDGGYFIVRGDETIRAVWFEGRYSIHGLPARASTTN